VIGQPKSPRPRQPARREHSAVSDQPKSPRPQQPARRAHSSGSDQPESHRPLVRFEDASLSEEERAIASHLHRRLVSAPACDVCLTDEKLAKATGVNVRRIAILRERLEKKCVIRSEAVGGRGTRYRMDIGYDLPESPVVVVPPWKPGDGPTYGERMVEVAEKIRRWQRTRIVQG
jgi:hypothetical protein